MNNTVKKHSVTTRAKRLAIQILIAAAIAVPVRASVITSFRIAGDSVAPELPNGSYVLVYRLASDFQPGDIVVYSTDSKTLVGRFKTAAKDGVRLSRNQEDVTVLPEQVIGRVVVGTR